MVRSREVCCWIAKCLSSVSEFFVHVFLASIIRRKFLNRQSMKALVTVGLAFKYPHHKPQPHMSRHCPSECSPTASSVQPPARTTQANSCPAWADRSRHQGAP